MNNETKHLKNSNSNKYIAPSLDTPINTKNNSKQKQSWREAKAIADVKLKKERDQNIHPHSLYFTDSKGWQRSYQWALAPPNTCLKILNHFLYLIFTCTTAGFAYFWGFSPVSIVAMTLLGINVWAKFMTTGTKFQKDDSAPFEILRMVKDDEKKDIFKQMKDPMGSFTKSESFVMQFNGLLTMGAVFGLYVYCLIYLVVTPIMHTVFWVFLTFMTSNHVVNIEANPFKIGIETYYFLPLAKQLTQMINTYEIVETITDVESGEDKLDFKNGYDNYNIMIELVENFSKTFASFFFFAEFTLVLGTLCFLIASYDQISLLINSPFCWKHIFPAVLITSLFIQMALFVKVIFGMAAGLTAAMLRLENRMHKFNAQVNSNFTNQKEESKEFTAHVIAGLHLTGFRSMGIVISESLGAKIAYAFISIIGTGGMIALRYMPAV